MPSRKNRNRVISAVILVTCAVFWFYLSGVNHEFFRGSSGTSGQSSDGSAELRQAPAFTLKDHEGAAHTLQESRGKMRLVHFWAAWCPPCLAEIPEIVEFAGHFQNEALEVIAISLDEKWEDAEKILASAKLPGNMISLLDAKGKVSDLYGTYQYPETYLINAEGRIIAKWVGAQPWTNPRTEALLRQQLAGIHSK
jgi:cytochrome c biogenesis protein CcmG/thiol:disulfide interchange protein DsbE